MNINLYLECKSFWIKMSAKCANIWINFQPPTQHHVHGICTNLLIIDSSTIWTTQSMIYLFASDAQLDPVCECVSPAGSMWLWLLAALPGGSDWLKLQTPAWQSTVYYIVWQLFHSWLLISGEWQKQRHMCVQMYNAYAVEGWWGWLHKGTIAYLLHNQISVL